MKRAFSRLFFSGLMIALTTVVQAAELTPATPAPQSDIINKLIAEGWQKAGIKKPADKATDFEFMRRSFIDLIGRIPTTEEVVDFEQDRGTGKRARLIQRLLYSKSYEPRNNGQTIKLEKDKNLKFSYTDEFSEHWANIWTVWLMTRSGHQTYRDQMNAWLTDELGGNTEAKVTPHDEFVTKLLTASGTTRIDANAANFIIHHLGEPVPAEKQAELGKFDAVPITSRVTRLFMGIQTNCTQCHDHPFNKEWIQSDFWGVNAFFRQTIRTKTPIGSVVRNNMMATQKDFEIELKDTPDSNASGIIFYERRDGKLMAIKPNFLKDLGKAESGDPDHKPIAKTETKSRRLALADYVVKHDNFAKAYVNRIWGHLFGRGMNKEPSIDDFGSHNEVVHPELLSKLATDFAQYKYDPKQLLYWICTSDVYGLSHVANKDYVDQKFEPYFARMPLKAMSPEVLFESLMTAAKADLGGDRKTQRNDFMKQLVSNFGDDEGNEINFNGTVVQALLLMNGKELNEEIGRTGANNPVVRLVDKHSKKKTAALNTNGMIDDLFLSTLSRRPTAAEVTRINTLMTKGQVIAGESPKAPDAPKSDSTKPAVVKPDLKAVVKPEPKKPMKNPGSAPTAVGPRFVPPSIGDHTPFFQDLFWALLNTNEFMLNH